MIVKKVLTLSRVWLTFIYCDDSDSVKSGVMLSVRGQAKFESFLYPAVYNPIFCVNSTRSRPSTWSSWSLDVHVLSDFE